MTSDTANSNVVWSTGQSSNRPHVATAGKWTLIAIFLAALLVRILVNAAFQGITAAPNPAFPDSILYANAAASVATGRYEVNGRPSMHAPPGIPVLIATAKSATLGSWLGPRLLYSLLGAATCLFAFGIASRIGGPVAGVLAAGVLAVYPDHFYWAMHFTPETPGAAFLMAALWLSMRLDRQPSTLGELALGVLIGLAALVTPRMLVMAPVLMLLRLAMCYRDRLREGLRGTVLTVIAVALTIAPWTYRNYLVSGQLVLVSSHGGSTFLAGNNPLIEADPAARGGWYQGPLSDIPGWTGTRTLPEADRSVAERRLATDFLKDLPLWRLVRLEVMKFYHLVTPILDSPNLAYRVLVGGGWALLAPVFILGLWRFGRRPSAYGLNAVLLGTLAITLVFFGESRYRAAIAPVLAVYGGLGLGSLLERWFPDTSAVIVGRPSSRS